MSEDKKVVSLKDKFFAHLETWRLYTVIWCGLVSLAGACLANNGFPTLYIAFLAFIIPMMGWTAGLYLSDFLDRKLDAIEKPHRPIPSGRIKPNEALIVGAVFAILGLVLSAYLGVYNLILVFVTAVLVFSYAKMSKSKGLIGNLNRGLVTVVAYLFGVFSVGLQIQSIPVYIWLFSFVFLVHDTNSNLVGAIRDMKGDKKGGYITIPVRYGVKKSIVFSLFLTILWFSMLVVIPFYYRFLNNVFYMVIVVDFLLVLSLYIYLFKSMKDHSRKKALKFHEFFVVERIVMASALIFGITSFYVAFIIFITTLTVTVISQFMLRKRYEFVDET